MGGIYRYMKILLVKPYPNPKHNFFDKFSLNSLTLKQIAAITPPEHDVDIIDERFRGCCSGCDTMLTSRRAGSGRAEVDLS